MVNSFNAQAEPDANEIYGRIKDIFPDAFVRITGEYRRCCEIITELTYLIGTLNLEIAIDALSKSSIVNNLTVNGDHINGETDKGLLVDIKVTGVKYFYDELFTQTGSEEHVKAVLARVDDSIDESESEELIYRKAGALPGWRRSCAKEIPLLRKPQIIPCHT